MVGKPMLTVGIVRLTVHVWVVTALTLPTVSVARAWKVCEPAANSAKLTGLSHDAYAAVSRRHSTVADASASVKAKVAVSPLGLAGVWVKTGAGGAVPSTTTSVAAASPVGEATAYTV